MITIESVRHGHELMALAREIHEDTGVGMDAAFVQAARDLDGLMADMVSDTRYVPCRVVMFESFSARELMEWTNRE